MTAEDYVQKYHDIIVPDYITNGSGTLLGINIVRTPVDEYCNRRYANRYRKSHSERWALRSTLVKFCDEQVGLPDTPLVRFGPGYTLANSIPPLGYCDKKMIDASFYGKASPEELYSTIHLLSYWRGWRKYMDGVADVATVNLIVDKYLGMDCNGFVGNYLKAKYAAFHLGPNTPEQDYFYNRAAVRDRVDDIQPDDVVLLIHKDKAGAINWSAPDMVKELHHRRSLVGHITVISRVLSRAGNQAQVVLSESRTSHQENGGPQSNTWTLKRTGKYRFDIVGRSQVVHSVMRTKHT